MQQELQAQDALLDELEVGVGRLKMTSSAIHAEATEQTKLLGEVEAETELADHELHAEVLQLTSKKLAEEKALWKWQLLVVGEVFLLVLLLLKGLMP